MTQNQAATSLPLRQHYNYAKYRTLLQRLQQTKDLFLLILYFPPPKDLSITGIRTHGRRQYKRYPDSNLPRAKAEPRIQSRKTNRITSPARPQT